MFHVIFEIDELIGIFKKKKTINCGLKVPMFRSERTIAGASLVLMPERSTD